MAREIGRKTGSFTTGEFGEGGQISRNSLCYGGFPPLGSQIYATLGFTGLVSDALNQLPRREHFHRQTASQRDEILAVAGYQHIGTGGDRDFHERLVARVWQLKAQRHRHHVLPELLQAIEQSPDMCLVETETGTQEHFAPFTQNAVVECYPEPPDADRIKHTRGVSRGGQQARNEDIGIRYDQHASA